MCVTMALPGRLQADELPFYNNVLGASAEELQNCSDEAGAT